MKKDRLLGLSLLGALALLMVFYFLDALALPTVMVERDLPIFFLPNLKLWVEGVKAGDFPLWNPYSFSGQPLFASLQTGVLYPPNLILFFLPIGLAFNLTIVFHFFLAGWFVFLLCREMGGSRPAGILSALSFTLGGFLLSIHNVLNTLQSVAWTPLIFYLLLRALRRHSRGYVLAAALAVLLQFLGAGIEVFMLTQGMVLLFMLFPGTLIPGELCPSWGWRLKGAAFIALFVFGLGAVQIFPFWEMLKHSIREGGFPFQEATRWSLDWQDLLYIFLPDFFYRGLEYYKTDQNYLKSIYLGLIPFLMVFFFWFSKDRRKLFFGLLLSGSLLLALGRNTPLYALLYHLVPGIQTIRYPVKFFFLTNLFICLLTGLGWDVFTQRLTADPQKKNSRLKMVFLLSALVCVLLLLGVSLFQGPLTAYLDKVYPISYARPWKPNLHNLERFSLFALFTFLLMIFLGDRKISPRWGSVLIIALLTLDLFLANWGFYRRADQKIFFSQSPNIQTVKQHQNEGRIFVGYLMFQTKVPRPMEMNDLTHYVLQETFYFDYPLIHRLYNAAGFGVLTYRPYQDILDTLYKETDQPRAKGLLRLMNVRFLLWTDEVKDPGWRLIRKGETYVLPPHPLKMDHHKPPVYKVVRAHLYENREALPRAFLVPNFLIRKDKNNRLTTLKEPSFDPTETVLLEERPAPPPPQRGELPETEQVELLKISMNELFLTASCRRSQFLFISDTFYPGWKVWVDGEEGKIYRANHAFRAVVLGPGRHRIQMIYDPGSLKWGMAVTLLSAAVLLLFPGAAKEGKEGRDP